jgi:beta-glucosidase
LALDAARQAIVLLKNEPLPLAQGPAALATDRRKQAPAPVLPFGDSLRGKTLALIGPVVNDTAIMMGGKSDYCPASTVSLCEGVQARAAAGGVTVTCTDAGGGPDFTDADAVTIAEAVAAADVVVLTVGGIFGHEQQDRTNISLPAAQILLVRQAVAQAAHGKVVLMVVNGDPIALDGIKDMVPAVVDVFEGGQAAGTAAAEMLFGDYSPSGMLPFTIYPDDFVTKVKMSDMTMRANVTTGSPGHTYIVFVFDLLVPSIT